MSRESRSARRKELKKLAGICSPKTVFAIGTFSLDADWERSEIGREVIGMGFFRERFVSDAVELIASEKIHRDLVAETSGILRKLGKRTILGRDRGGIFYNRFVAPLQYVGETVYFRAFGR